MAGAAPIPPTPIVEHRQHRSRRKKNRDLWYDLRRRPDLRRLLSTAFLWTATVLFLLIIARQVIK